MNDAKETYRIEDFKTLYFLGIGGMGMSSLARYFHRNGWRVIGYDAVSSDLTRELEKEGIGITDRDDPTLVEEELQKSGTDPVLVIMTPAIPENNAILGHFKKKGVPIRKRADILGWITQDLYTIAVAGTHGKTTTAAMISHLLNTAGIPCNAFLGGIPVDTGSNLVLHREANTTVVEADEYARSFLYLVPDIAVVTSIEPDHMDVYGEQKELENAFREFTGNLREKGPLFLHERLENGGYGKGARTFTYGKADEKEKRPAIECFDIEARKGTYRFSVSAGKTLIRDIAGKMPGDHNAVNATAAIGVALEMGVKAETIRTGMENFNGLKRRFEFKIHTTDRVFIDDYAHHPTELRACIETARTLFPGRHITGIFQPHLYTRTRDLAQELAESLSNLDEVVLMEIYPAREEPIAGVDARMLLERIPLKDRSLLPREKIPEAIRQKDPEVLLTMGAGDIDRLTGPIKEALSSGTTEATP